MKRVVRVLATVAVVAALTVASPLPANAETISVTTNTDVVDGADGLTSLREAVTLANDNGQADTITLSAQTYTLSLCGQGEMLYDEAEDLTIEGNGATIVQTCPDQRILDKAGSNETVLAISDLTVENTVNSGANIAGAVFRAESQLILDNVVIDGVNAGFSGSLVAFDFGPATNDLELHDVTITNNTGRGIDNLNPAGVLVVGSTISNNSGSGVSLGDGNPLVVQDSTIVGNGGHGISTSGQGNGIQPVVTIANSTVSGNQLGGFLCLTSCRSLEVTGSTISGNGAGAPAGFGGGLVMSVFTDNVAPIQSVTITDSTIADNTADHPGGGLLVAASFEVDGDESPTTTISGSIISGNQANCADCDGGGIAVQVGDLSIIDSTVEANTAGGNGGGVSQRQVSYDTITAPTAFSMIDTTITDNSSGADGGGLWVHSATQQIERSLIAGNDASNVAGGVEVGGSTVDALSDPGAATIVESTIAGNTAAFGGGLAIGSPDGSAASLLNVTVTGNEGTTAGGGFAVGGTESLDLRHTTVADNVSPVGSNLAASGVTTVEASVISGGGGGGASCEPFPFAPIPLHMTSNGFNWFDDASCPAIADDVVDVGGDPQLGALADNGGQTLTVIPADASPLVSLIAPADCTVSTDQRGEARPTGSGCEPGATEIEGGAGDGDEITGTDAPDILVGTDGEDTIIGLNGADFLTGLGGDDHLDGGSGPDVLDGGSGTNTLLGGNGADVINAKGEHDAADGGSGRDLLIDWVGGNTLRGGPGRDILISRGRDTVFDGGPGRDLCIEPGRTFRC